MPNGFLKPENRAYAGRTLADIAAERGQDWLDTAIDLLLSEEQRIFTVYFMMDEENVKLQLKQPWMKISTDAGGVDPACVHRRMRARHATVGDGGLHRRGYFRRLAEGVKRNCGNAEHLHGPFCGDNRERGGRQSAC